MLRLGPAGGLEALPQNLYYPPPLGGRSAWVWKGKLSPGAPRRLGVLDTPGLGSRVGGQPSTVLKLYLFGFHVNCKIDSEGWDMYTGLEMPALRQFLVRHLASGTMATIMAYSPRGAAEQYAATIKYRQLLKSGRDIEVKERGANEDWALYRVK